MMAVLTKRNLLLIFFISGILWLLFLMKPQVKAGPSVHVKEREDGLLILYNRIPKTGSTSFMSVLYKLHHQNQFALTFVNVSSSNHRFTFIDQYKFARNITYWYSFKPALFHGHFPFMNFRQLGMKPPIYINMIREPLERLVSHYYFIRYGDTYLPNKVRQHQGDSTTFDECVKQESSQCSPKKLWLQIPYFCGSDVECWEPGNKQALRRAKANVMNNYFLVGTTDNMEKFIELLEYTLPSIFKDSTKLYSANGGVHIRKTKVKKPLLPETIQYFKNDRVWKMENEFFLFVAKRFNVIYDFTLQSKKKYKISYLKLKSKYDV